jgi:predicted enzyme related to lactoylglutathione lyase
MSNQREKPSRRDFLVTGAAAAAGLGTLRAMDMETVVEAKAEAKKMARVTGIGGVFLRSPDPKKLTAWYAEHLGIKVSAWGVSFAWSDEVPAGTGKTAWSTFPETTKYLGEPTQQVMINYRVDDLDAMLEQLTKAGVWVDPKRDNADFGKFAWIKDCDGNRVELWEPKAK